MKVFTWTAVAVFALATSAFAADQTLAGRISDSRCGATHQTKAEHGKKMSAAQCTEACVKGGAKYVFVSGGKVYNIANQDAPNLAADAGRRVRLTGSVSGDTITVSKLESARVAKAGRRGGKKTRRS